MGRLETLRITHDMSSPGFDSMISGNMLGSVYAPICSPGVNFGLIRVRESTVASFGLIGRLTAPAQQRNFGFASFQISRPNRRVGVCGLVAHLANGIVRLGTLIDQPDYRGGNGKSQIA